MTQSFICYTYNAEVTLKVTNLMVSLSEDSTFEEFTDGPSPNTNYQQKIETVGKVVNIFDYVTPLVAEENGLKNDLNEDGSITTSGKPTNNYVKVCTNVDIIDKLEDGEEYTMLQGTKQTGLLYMQLAGLKADGTYSYWFSSLDNKVIFTVDKKKYKKYLISVQTGTLANWGTESRTITNTYMLYKGKERRNFSKYNQGCVEIIKRNKNQLSLPEQTGTSNGVTHHFKNGTVTLQGTLTDSWCTAYSKEDFYLKKGTYSFFATNLDKQFEARMYLKNGKTQSFWLASFAWKKTVTFEADVIACYMVYHHATKGEEVNISIDIQLEAGESFSDFIIPKQEVFIVPTQQELLGNDYINTTEHHEWHKLILTGTEPWYCETNGRFGYLVQNLPKAYKKTIQTSDLLGNVCNSYIEKTPAQTWKGTQGFCIDPGGSLRIWDDSYSKTSDLAGFKAMLAEKYNAGNPVVCYLKLATPIELELTDDQKAISKYLQPYDDETTILVIDKLATITASYTKKGENDEN